MKVIPKKKIEYIDVVTVGDALNDEVLGDVAGVSAS